MTPREQEMIEEFADIIGKRMIVDHYKGNPAQGYVIVCRNDKGSYLTVNHHGFGTSTGPWPAALMSKRFKEQVILLLGATTWPPHPARKERDDR